MSDNIKWGPAIAVDGKRPGWLCSGEWRRVRTLAVGEWQTADIESPGDTIPDMDEWNWGDITAIRLPADHPHYRQPAPIPEGMKPWAGGDEAPADFDPSKPVMYPDGDLALEADNGGSPFYWQHSFDARGFHGAGNIIAYTPQPTPQADTKPDVTAEAGRDALALLRKMSKWDGSFGLAEDAAAALNIVASVPEPVDPDLIEARAMAKKLASDTDSRWGSERHCNKYDSGELDDNLMAGVSLAYDAIKRGRELALAGETGK